MNFNTDDPLADLLSDNSLDNDNFFENQNPATNTRNKIRGAANKPKGQMEDLFGIKEEAEQNSAQSKRREMSSGAPPKITKQKPTFSMNDEDDDDYLGFDPRKPRGAAKANLFDDLLGTIADTKRPATAAPALRREDNAAKAPAISRQSTDTTTENSNIYLSQTRPKTSVGRRSSGMSAITNADPLGLFGGPAKDKEINTNTAGTSTPKATSRPNTSDWLGLNVETAENVTLRQGERSETPKKVATALKQNITNEKDNVDILKLPETEDIEQGFEEHFHETHAKILPPADVTAQNILLLNSMNMEAKNSFNALQQQESQLVLATQMKQQEKALLQMQRKQDNLLSQQERQFQALLQQQIQRQQQMEEHIKLQQQRINTHIQLMMSQPVMVSSALHEREDINTPMEKFNITPRNHSETPNSTLLDVVQMEADIKRLELEKQRLEDLAESMKTNYENEIALIESSYKKQLKFVDDHQTAIESRSKAELEDSSKYYTNKIDMLESERQKLKTEHETEISSIKSEFDAELNKVRKSHENELEMLKEEHIRMVERIRQAKMLEFAAIQESGSYMETLKMAFDNLENMSGGLQHLRDDMQMKMERLNKEKEKNLENRERKLEDAEKRLKLTGETTEDEKRRLMELVATLELQLGKLSKESAEENWLLRQKMASLEAEKSAFEREKEFARAQLQSDEKRIADLKELQLAQTQKLMAELQQERTQLVVERAKIETERKLQPNIDLEKERLEIEAALKVAQDATQQADAERQRYLNLQRQLEQKKRELVDKEHALRVKEDETEQELCSFRVAERKSQETQQKAQLAEQNFQMKITFLQQRMREVGEKEANLSHERMLLAQERIAVQNRITKLNEHKCALCKMSEQNAEITHMLNKDDNIREVANGGRRAGDTAAAAAIVHTNMNPNDVSCAMTIAANKTEIHHMLGEQTNIVDRMLDEHIAESYRKMKAIHGHVDLWSDSVLDDDSKELALHNFDQDFQNNANSFVRDLKTDFSNRKPTRKQ